MKIRNNITLSDILEIVTEPQILYYYLKYPYINGNILSPFHVEKSPSFSIKLFNNKIKYKLL